MDRVVHFEIPFDDGERATTFYREAFGWQTDAMPQFQYVMVTTAPTGAAGINGGMLRREGPITSPVVTIQVEDLDDATARIEKLGGRVVLGRRQVGQAGFSAYVEDTEGNVIGLWQTA